jgi:hypothetical protein
MPTEKQDLQAYHLFAKTYDQLSTFEKEMVDRQIEFYTRAEPEVKDSDIHPHHPDSH